jgi:hypothetical protein
LPAISSRAEYPAKTKKHTPPFTVKIDINCHAIVRNNAR